MIKKLQKTLFIALCLSVLGLFSNAQVIVTVDGGSAWTGYMNVFDLGGGYQFGSSWGLSDLKTTINAATNEITLQPNYQTYNAADPYWSNGLIGNKIMEANTFVEPAGVTGQTLIFEGNIVSNNLAASYSAVAFIKALDPAAGYSAVVFQTVPLPTSGAFSISAMIPNNPSLIVQYGFTINGLNANPVDEAAFGSVVVTPSNQPLSNQLTSLDMSVDNNKAQLKWATSASSNIKFFEVEKSFNNSNFSSVGTVEANNVTNTYTFTNEINSSVAYYRLKFITDNGNYGYSKVLTANNNIDDPILIFPNPSSSELNLISANNIERLDIINTTGSVVKSINVMDKSAKLDISHLRKGLYFIRTKNNNLGRFEKL